MVTAAAQILDQFGNPYPLTRGQSREIGRIRAHYQRKIHELRATYDATRDGAEFANHWSNADTLSPQSGNSYEVRRKLRSRSRFEVIENNPYLKGTALTLVNDFVGSGPWLKITDKRLPDDARLDIAGVYSDWQKATRYRRKLWRMRMGKLVDGEGIKRSFWNPKVKHPVKLDFQVIEADQMTTRHSLVNRGGRNFLALTVEDLENDGVRFDKYGNPLEYYILDRHPGSNFWSFHAEGKWYEADAVTHWFRQDRGWVRGIPEAAASLSLCAILRRYTLAVVKTAEGQASFTGVLESEMPPSLNQWDQPEEDEPFENFPIEHGMFTTLPWGYTLKSFDANQPLPAFDAFVGSVLREIIRPLLVPFNMAAGTSKDSNMASAVVDEHIYKEGQKHERIDCGEEVCDPDFDKWWRFARDTIPRFQRYHVMLDGEIPRHRWRWDRIGLDHTDPSRVARALEISHKNGFITDEDIQEGYHGRDVEDWRQEMHEQVEYRREVGLPGGGASAGNEPGDNGGDSGDDDLREAVEDADDAANDSANGQPVGAAHEGNGRF